MKLLTINLGLLDYSVCGLTLFSNPPYSAQRIQVMPTEIIKVDADIVAVQECYSEHHMNYICDAVKHIYPFCAREHGGMSNIINLHNGLMILSKYEIQSTDIFRHDKVMCVEDWFGNKATLIANIWVNGIGRLSVINTHPTAGGMDPESEKANIGREFALRQTLEAAEVCRRNGSLPILIGDFNCAPDCSAANYELIVNSGYRDCYIEAAENKVLKDCPDHTWDPFNMLNATGPHAHTPPARLDHVFLPKSEPKFGPVRHCDIVFTEKTVKVPVSNFVTEESHSLCSMSDHYGLVVEFDLH